MPYTLTVFSSQPLQVEKLSEADADRRRLALMQARDLGSHLVASRRISRSLSRRSISARVSQEDAAATIQRCIARRRIRAKLRLGQRDQARSTSMASN